MEDVLSFVVDAIGSAMTLYGAAHVLALSRPLFFYETFASRADPKTKLHAALVYTLVALKFISIGKFFYHAGSGIFDIIPEDWMTYDEDGEPVNNMRGYLQVLFAIVGTAFALDGETKVSTEGKRLLQDRREKWGY